MDVFIEMEYANSLAISDTFDLALGLLEIAGIAMLFLIFFPPAFYRLWIAPPEIDRAEA